MEGAERVDWIYKKTTGRGKNRKCLLKGNKNSSTKCTSNTFTEGAIKHQLLYCVNKKIKNIYIYHSAPKK